MDLLYVGKIILSIVMALLPAIIWLEFINQESEKKPQILVWVFIYGCLSVIPILGLQFLWILKGEIDIYEQIQGSVSNQEFGFLLTFIAVGVIEEIAKFSVLKYIDVRKKLKITTIGESVKYVIVAALGFAFIENILYFSSFLLSEKITQAFYNIIFRSIFTTCAHLVFSGIIGYYYALGKFAPDIMEQEGWEGKKFPIINKLHNLFKVSKIRLFRFKKLGQGLGLAVCLHASFNYFLQKGLLDAALLLVIIGAVIVYYLMKKKSGYLIFLGKRGQKSMMSSKDENVVIELLGLWLSQEKYREVEEICERLLKRDPDNNIVRLFRAKAHDKLKLKTAIGAVKALFTKDDFKADKTIFEELKSLKEKNNNEENQTLKSIEILSPSALKKAPSKKIKPKI